MKQVTELTLSAIIVAFLAVAVSVTHQNDVNKNCYQWEGCKTSWNEKRGRCESVCKESDTFKNRTMDCTRPCLSNGFCYGNRHLKDSCKCVSVCKKLKPCMSWIYEDCDKWGEFENDRI